MDINFNTIILEDLITGYLFSNYVELFLMNNTCRNGYTVCKIQNCVRSYDMTYEYTFQLFSIKQVTK